MDGKKITVGCTWGDGPDMLLNVSMPDETRFGILFSVPLSVSDALDLKRQLFAALSETLDIQEKYEQYVIAERMKAEPINDSPHPEHGGASEEA